MLKHHIIDLLLWLICIQLWIITRLPAQTCVVVDAFTTILYAPTLPLHQFYITTGILKCRIRAKQLRSGHCRGISNGFNEANLNISSTYNDEDISDSCLDTRSETLPDKDEKALLNVETRLMNRRSIRGITLKLALDRNGGVAGRSEIRPERFTCTESLDMVHRLRSQSDAVLIGVGTAITDNPSLLVRRNIVVDQQPLRVVIDPMLRLLEPIPVSHHNTSYQLLTDGYPLVIYHCRNDTAINPVLELVPPSVQLHYIPPIHSNRITDAPRICVQSIFDHLQEKYKVKHLMVEGGPRTAQLFLQSNLIDRCILVQAPVQFDDPILSNITPSVLQSANLVQVGSVKSGTDLLECWTRPNLPWPTSDVRHWP
jgi:diaminohydroxyphosphoribosylaminopyrimidine deaminase/5-amino-6-(5-phosphoribosylamino)uracil reductase